MKKCFTLIFCVLFSFLLFGQKESLLQKDTASIDTSKFLPATLTALHDGEFLDPKTYGGEIPKPGDNIIIPRGTSVTISGVINFNNTGDDATTIFVSGQLLFGNKGKLTLAPGSVFYGNPGSIVDRDGKEDFPVLKIGNATFYGGSDSTLQGPLLFPTGVLPESFLNVTVSNKLHVNLVNWSTIRESNAKTFELMRSTNGAKWEVVSSIPASGNSRTVHTYLFKDSGYPSTICYYKVKIIDETGKGQFSFIRSAKNVDSKDMTAR